MKVESLKKLRERWERNIVKRKGKDFLKKNAKSLQEQWDYLVEGGFINEGLPQEIKKRSKGE